MSLLDMFKSNKESTCSASVAKQRLQILVAHERMSRSTSHDFLPAMQEDIMKVVEKYIMVSKDNVSIRLENDEQHSYLEVNVQLPD